MREQGGKACCWSLSNLVYCLTLAFLYSTGWAGALHQLSLMSHCGREQGMCKGWYLQAHVHPSGQPHWLCFRKNCLVLSVSFPCAGGSQPSLAELRHEGDCRGW
jgi:hypothetical protein